MKLNLAGKVALVTGGSRGIGAAICRALAEEGVRVGVNYARHEEKAEEVVASIAQAGKGGAVALKGDLERASEIAALFDRLEDCFGPVDILVNNAAYCPGGPIGSYSVEEWEKTFRVNVTGAFVACQEHVRRLLAAGRRGKVVNIVSQAAFLGSTSGHLPYDASKGALVSMTRAVAREVAQAGINVNAVAPGMVRTEMVADKLAANLSRYLSRIPLNRVAEPEDVANAVVFLASSAADYMTGATLDLTGGLMMR
jgi:3-oxoacyl-[acyl-carrier protein] reductase